MSWASEMVGVYSTDIVERDGASRAVALDDPKNIDNDTLILRPKVQAKHLDNINFGTCMVRGRQTFGRVDGINSRGSGIFCATRDDSRFKGSTESATVS